MTASPTGDMCGAIRGTRTRTRSLEGCRATVTPVLRVAQSGGLDPHPVNSVNRISNPFRHPSRFTLRMVGQVGLEPTASLTSPIYSRLPSPFGY